MFKVGDMVFYPMHGAGYIEAIEEKEILGESNLYYVLNMPQKNVQISVPKKTAPNSGMRELVTLEILDSVLDGFFEGNTDPDLFLNQRYCASVNKTKIKSGDIFQICEVIRDLTRKSKKSKLGLEDKHMLDNACQIFISEVVHVKEINAEQAAMLLDQVLDNEKTASSL